MEIPRLLLKNFRSVLRHMRPDRNARPGLQWLVLRAGSKGLTIQAQDTDVALSVRADASQAPEVLTLPASALADLEGRAGNVVFEATGTSKTQARWTDGAVPRVVEFDGTDIAMLPAFPEVPGTLVANPPGFLTALDEAMRTTADDSTRYALAKVQLRGSTGQLAATNGRQALIQNGFKFGFSQDLLIPKVTAFGCKELPQDVPVAVGKSDRWCTVQVGAWAVFLAVDTESRYPRIEDVMPKGKPATVWKLDPSEAEFLRQALPKLPGDRDENSPITVDLNGHAVIRAKSEGQDKAVELPLTKSTVEGKAVRFCMNRHLLSRVLAMGLLEIQIIDAESALVTQDAQRRYLWMPLPRPLPPSENAHRIAVTPTVSVPSRPIPTTQRRSIVPRKRTNGQPPVQAQPATNGSGIGTLINEARELKAQMRSLCGRSQHLVNALQQHRRRAKVVDSTLRSLKKNPDRGRVTAS